MQHDLTALNSADAAKIKVTDMAAAQAFTFLVEPDATWRADIAKAIDIIGVKKLRLEGQLEPLGKSDWQLTAKLGATVVQPCVVTLDPVTSRIDEPVARTYLHDMPELPEAAEVEMPEDETEEALPAVIDLAQVMTEALALALPLYPRVADAELENANFAAPGVAPMTDEDAKPFAGLKGLRDKLGNTD